LEDAARNAGLEVSTTAKPGLLTLFFAPEPPRDYKQAKGCDLDAYAAFCRGMLDRGIYLPPSQFEAWFPSLAHTDAHVQQTLAAAREAFAEL
jgi:glutamate-1-semialdehyde 2,1-aminomutase